MENNFNIVDSIASYLNELYEADPVAIRKLINIEIKCNDIIANHPRLLTRSDGEDSYITFLGVLNGTKEIDGSIARTSGQEILFVNRKLGG